LPKPYYLSANGLRFECTRCGDCCTRPGPVYFPPEDLQRAAAHLGTTPEGFLRRYRARRGNGVAALDGGDAPCPLYDADRGCTIYEARPTQCRTFPFWPELVNRKRSWEHAGKSCEGIGRGKRHAPAAIEPLVVACRETLPPEDPW
jgi:Fe-S-cluster containining protein